VANNWIDKLPIILPTEERVAEMVAHTSHKPDEVVGHMRPTHFREAWEYTVEKVAVKAVMAAARPEYFPVILAIAASGVSARGSTTSSAAGMCVVNGPVRHELNMNCGIGATAPVREICTPGFRPGGGGATCRPYRTLKLRAPALRRRMD
jgi:hypothetical protein